MPGGYGLGGGFGKYEENDGYQNSGNDNSLFSPDGDSHRCTEGSGGSIDKVVAQQDGGQELLRPLNHPGYSIGSLHLGADQVLQPYPLYGSKRRLRAGKEGRQQETDNKQYQVQDNN